MAYNCLKSVFDFALLYMYIIFQLHKLEILYNLKFYALASNHRILCSKACVNLVQSKEDEFSHDMAIMLQF